MMTSTPRRVDCFVRVGWYPFWVIRLRREPSPAFHRCYKNQWESKESVFRRYRIDGNDSRLVTSLTLLFSPFE